jgi:hypothetical protein
MEPIPELSAGWRDWGRAVAAFVAATFAVGTVLSVLDGLNITTPEPPFASDSKLPDRIVEVLQNQSQRFPWVLAATLVAAFGFAAIAALAPVLRRALGATEWRASVITGGLVIGAAIGIIAELGFIGGQIVASDPTYCQCDFADIQLIARSGLLDLVSTVQTWLLAGFLSLVGAGLFATAGAARRSAVVPRGWTALTTVLAVLMVAIAVWIAGFPLLANALRLQVDVDTITAIPSLVVLLVMVPWWALWLRSWLGGVAPASSADIYSSD